MKGNITCMKFSREGSGINISYSLSEDDIRDLAIKGCNLQEHRSYQRTKNSGKI